MVRRADGSAFGYLKVAEARTGFGAEEMLAVPVGWDAKEAIELGFERAEEVRLTYVAVTRAREELLVARWPGGRGTSPWASLDPWLDERAQLLEIEAREPEPRETLDLSADAAESAVQDAAERIRAMAAPGYAHVSVTETAKSVTIERSTRPAERSQPGVEFRGFSWGSAVHGALAAAADESSHEGLRATCRDLLVEHGRPVDDHGEPLELRELLDLVRTVHGSELWTRAQAAERRLVEVPFAARGLPDAARGDVPRGGPEAAPARKQLDLFASQGESAVATPVADSDVDRAYPRRVLEGVIDLAFREPDGWVIADYKTDVGADPDFRARTDAYRRQVDLYAEAWAQLTGETVKERVLYYTTLDRIERW
jgi:ATP-dependent helicase/nuclease subunit A